MSLQCLVRVFYAIVGTIALTFAAEANPSSEKLYDINPSHRKKIIRTNQGLFDYAITGSRAIVAKFGSQSDKKLVDQLEFVMSTNWHPYQARASQGKIEVDIGLIHLMHEYALSIQIERLSPDSNARIKFLEEVYDYMAGDTKEISDTIFRFPGSFDEKMIFFRDPKLIEERELLMITAVTGVSLHEFCHHKLKHTSKPLYTEQIDKLSLEELKSISEKSVEREKKADECAMDLLTRAGVPPIIAFLMPNTPGIFLDNIYERNSITRLSSHPMTKSRLDSAIEYTNIAFKNFRDNPSFAGKVFDSDIKIVVDNLSFVIEELETIGLE